MSSTAENIVNNEYDDKIKNVKKLFMLLVKKSNAIKIF